MNIFPQNYCRICLAFFCCEKCRLSHEQTVHGIHPECDICIYGKTSLKRPSSSLLQHLTKRHLPLHCLYCKKLFTSSKDIIQHSTCITREKLCNQEISDMVITSVSAVESNYDSPPITAIMHKSILTSSSQHFGAYNNAASLTTSTPLPKSNEREMMDNIPEVITPVDYSENVSNKLKSVNTTKSTKTPVTFEQSKNAEPSLKRRVTFCETPIINHPNPGQSNRTKDGKSHCGTNSTSKGIQFSKINEFDDNEDIAADCSSNDQDENYITANKDDKSSYITADKGDTDSTNSFGTKEISENECNHLFEVDRTQSYEPTSNDTMWESALMDQNLTKSQIPSPIIDPCLMTPNIISTLKQTNLKKLDNLSPTIGHVKEENISSPLLNPNFGESQILSPIIAPELLKSETLPSSLDQHLPEKYLLPMADQYSTISDVCFPILNSDLTELENQDISNMEDVSKIEIKVCQIEDITDISQITSSKQGLWSSMASIVKTVVEGLSRSTESNDCTRYERKDLSGSHKRPKPEGDDVSVDESPVKKRIKLMDIRCRRTIRDIRPLQHIQYSRMKVKYVDKWTQTD